MPHTRGISAPSARLPSKRSSDCAEPAILCDLLEGAVVLTTLAISLVGAPGEVLPVVQRMRMDLDDRQEVAQAVEHRFDVARRMSDRPLRRQRDFGACHEHRGNTRSQVRVRAWFVAIQAIASLAAAPSSSDAASTVTSFSFSDAKNDARPPSRSAGGCGPDEPMVCSSFFVHDVGDAFSERLRPHSVDRTWAAQWVRSMIPGTCDDVERASMVLRPLFAESSRRTSGRHVVPNGEALGRSRPVRSLQPVPRKLRIQMEGRLMREHGNFIARGVTRAHQPATSPQPPARRCDRGRVPAGLVETSASPPSRGIP